MPASVFATVILDRTLLDVVGVAEPDVVGGRAPDIVDGVAPGVKVVSVRKSSGMADVPVIWGGV